MAAAALVLPAVPITSLDYHRIIDETLTIPSDKTLPIPVGLLACQRDPLLRELNTVVVSCNVHHPENLGTSNRKKKASTPKPTDKLYEVVLHDTILFPEGGGQPSDTGLLRTANHGDFEVVEVKRKGGHAVHFVKAKDDSEEEKGLEVGSAVTAVLDDPGHSRRLDHMCMHTSQHLLSALLETHLNLPTFSWSLTTFPTPSYVELPRPLTQDEIKRIQNLAHTLAFEGRKVHVEVERLGPDNHPGTMKSREASPDRSSGKPIPSDYTGGVKRTVVIDGVDRNPCCGTHLPSLHNLQLFLLPQPESHARGSTSTSRLFFLCGPRLHEHLSTSHTLLTETAGIMSCGTPLVSKRVNQIIDERKRAEKRGEELEMELSKFVADMLATEMKMQSGGEGSNEKPYLKHYHRLDDPTRALSFLQAIVSSFEKIQHETSRPFTLILSSSPSTQTATSVTTVMILGSDAERTKVAGKALKAKLSVKGGGKGLRWSGKWVGVWKDAEGEVVKDVLVNL